MWNFSFKCTSLGYMAGYKINFIVLILQDLYLKEFLEQSEEFLFVNGRYVNLKSNIQNNYKKVTQ